LIQLLNDSLQPAHDAREVSVATYSFKNILVEAADGVAFLTLNRPKKRNAMSPGLHLDVADALEQLRYDPAAKVVVITGAGESFCAGMDLKEFFTDLGDKPDEYDRVFRIATEWRGRTLRYFPKPTIAMVNGFCFGGAFSIVEGCDLAVAADEATFGLSEVNFGLFPGGSVSKSLANIMHPRDAMYYALTGKPFDGKKAAEIKFVNYSVPLAELHANVTALATELAQKNAEALAATKEGFTHSLDMGWEASISFTKAREGLLSKNQNDAFRTTGIGDFLKGKYRPGLESNTNL
jgi:trans-feruloyl-CoA hydratase/vanillin synthase